MSPRDRTWIGAAIVAAFITSGGLLFTFAIPSTNEQLLTYMLGQLSGLATAIVSFHFGSSRGSEEKTAAMAAMSDPVETASDWPTFKDALK